MSSCRRSFLCTVRIGFEVSGPVECCRTLPGLSITTRYPTIDDLRRASNGPSLFLITLERNRTILEETYPRFRASLLISFWPFQAIQENNLIRSLLMEVISRCGSSGRITSTHELRNPPKGVFPPACVASIPFAFHRSELIPGHVTSPCMPRLYMATSRLRNLSSRDLFSGLHGGSCIVVTKLATARIFIGGHKRHFKTLRTIPPNEQDLQARPPFPQVSAPCP